MPTDPTFLGVVKDVRGATISVSLDDNTLPGLIFIDGYGYRIGQVGSFVKIPIGYIDLFGIVSQVGAGSVPENLVLVEPHGYRWMTVQIVGESYGEGEFKRGISQYPTVGDKVLLVTEKDLYKIYGYPDKANFIPVGHVASAESIKALINIDRLVTRHSAVVGTTGSGKSTTVAGLLLSLSDEIKYPSARIIVLDIHGEYNTALKDKATFFKVKPSSRSNELPLCIPYWAMTFDELLSVTFGTLDDTNRAAVLEKVTELKLNAIKKSPRDGVNEKTLTVDSPVPFSIHKLWYDLYRKVNATHTMSGNGQSEDTEAIIEKGDAIKIIAPKYKPATQAAGVTKIFQSASPINIRRQLDSLATKLRDPRFDFLFRPGEWATDEEGVTNKDLDCLLEQWIGGQKSISVLDLSGIPVSVLTNLVGVLLRVIYDALFWARNLSEGGRERPLLVVLEEAHNYLGTGDSGPASLEVRRIVKEGRKYGIGAMIVSQRPSEVDTTILSQCGTFFALRLSNPTDRAHVVGAVSDNLEGLFSMLPVLRTGEAIIVGEAVQLPVRALIDPPARDSYPNSKDPLVFDDKKPGGWNRKREKSNYEEVVMVWRKQEPDSPRIVNKEEGKTMKREIIASSNITSIGYDSGSLTLEIEFNNGNIYQYFDVPQGIYDSLMQASSKGQFLADNIKGSFRYARV